MDPTPPGGGATQSDTRRNAERSAETKNAQDGRRETETERAERRRECAERRREERRNAEQEERAVKERKKEKKEAQKEGRMRRDGREIQRRCSDSRDKSHNLCWEGVGLLPNF